MAKADCARVLEVAKASGSDRVVLAGKSDLAEIAVLCAVEAGMRIVAVVDSRCEDERFVGVDVFKSYVDVKEEFDVVMVTDVTRAKPSFDAALVAVGAERVLVPALLGLRSPDKSKGGAQ
jgi:D-arabinose 1-dehydrogenase-like Zn-dependent alcohol dehydrogenase